MGAPGTWSINERPGNGIWNPETAMTFADVINWIDVYRFANLPISREMIALFFFHESAFCSVSQAGGGPGVGLGQLEVLNPKSDKPAFLRSLGLTPNRELARRIASDPKFSIELQCKYYFDKFTKGVHSRPGMMDAQIGARPPNSRMTPKFLAAERELINVLFSGNRNRIITALNMCRWYLDTTKSNILHQPILLSRYRRYWDYTLAEGDLTLALRR